jgi:uncharacterized DUF497 family protein
VGPPVGFEWDPWKAADNLQKHGVSFAEAATVFDGPHAASRQDREHSISEDRYQIIGYSDAPRLLVVAYTERGDTVRVISAREAESDEQRQYEAGDWDR